MNRLIKKVAVLGSGIMGSRIACHFANIGVPVLLLDIVPKELTEAEKEKGLTLESKAVKNRIVDNSLQTAVKSNPSPLYRKSFSSRIVTGNFTDNMKDVADADWIIEVVIESLDIKKKVFAEVEKFRKPGTLITSNTSGIPIHLMSEGRSEDFQKHFCGTHFFNPPRYLRLLEIIPGPQTDPEVLDFIAHYGEVFLGKTTVLCKDTPAFIANRVGVYAIMALFHLVEKMELRVEEVDKLTGPVLGRPKSATFRTCDVVGIDTLMHVANGVRENCRDDESVSVFEIPSYIKKMLENNWLGDKTRQGFYKKTKTAEGKTEILSLDLKTMEYKAQVKTKFATLESAKTVDNLGQRMKVLMSGSDKAGEFYRSTFYGLFEYVSNRIPEIADHIYQVDDAMRAGFGWEMGPFQAWDALGVDDTVKAMEGAGRKSAAWVYEMLKSGKKSFYALQGTGISSYDKTRNDYEAKPGTANLILLDGLRKNNTVWKNSGATLFDTGNGIANLEFHTKMNTIGGEVLDGINKAIEIGEKDFRGLVIGNEAENFSAGANLAMVFMFAVEQEFDEIDFAIRAFQNVNMRIKMAAIPVVIAPRGLTLGGGCEMCMHAAAVQPAAETYIGLVEFGVGLIPGGGGTKEFAIRINDELSEGDIELNNLKDKFLIIATAKVATSAHEAFDMGIFKEGRDQVSMNLTRQLTDAKNRAIELAESGYTRKTPRKDIKVMGKSGLGMVYAGANTMYSGHYMSEYDKYISEKLGYVICGGDLSSSSLVSEQYLLDLEREAFLSLCGEKKTLERIQSILTTGKPLRN
jgi:3-hydroxyacyl-CoA dehydrogenase